MKNPSGHFGHEHRNSGHFGHEHNKHGRTSGEIAEQARSLKTEAEIRRLISSAVSAWAGKNFNGEPLSEGRVGELAELLSREVKDKYTNPLSAKFIAEVEVLVGEGLGRDLSFEERALLKRKLGTIFSGQG